MPARESYCAADPRGRDRPARAVPERRLTMAFTDHSDLFAVVHENGINATILQLMQQRPSLFNYATLIFTQALSSQFCVPINAGALAAGQPLFTVESQLPVPGAPRPLGLDWCLQLTNVSVDLYPGNTLTLPPELD